MISPDEEIIEKKMEFKTYLHEGFIPLKEGLELTMKIGLLEDLLFKLDSRDYTNGFEIVSSLLTIENEKTAFFSNNKSESQIKCNTFRNLLDELRYNKYIDNISKYINNLNHILKTYLQELDLIIKKIIPLENVSKNNIYYYIFKFYQDIVLKYLKNIEENKIKKNYKKYLYHMSEMLLNIYQSIYYSFYQIFICLDKEDEYKEYLIYLIEVLEKLDEEKRIKDELANNYNYYFDAVSSSLNINASMFELTFDGQNNEYKRVRENLLYRKEE